MKYFTLIIFLVPLFFFGNHSTEYVKTSPTTIHLRIKGLSAGTVYLTGFHKNVQSKVDSAQIDPQGNIYFKQEQAFAPGFYVAELPDSLNLQILMDHDQVFSLETSADHLMKNMRVSGSMENELLYNSLQYDLDLEARFQSLVEQAYSKAPDNPDLTYLEQQREQIINERKAYCDGIFKKHPSALFTKFEKARQQPEILQTIFADASLDEVTRQQLLQYHFWDEVDFSDPRLLHTPAIFNKLVTYLFQLVPDQTEAMTQAIDQLMNKVIGYPEYYRFFAEWITEYFQPNPHPLMDPEAIYVHMVDNYLTRERVFWADSTQVSAWQFRAVYRASSLLGRKAANIEGKNPEGQMRSLYDIQSPYIAIFFYHAECSHCIEETPKLVEFYREWKNKGLEVFAVAMDTEDAEWKDFIARHQINWLNITDKDNLEIYNKYSVPGTPDIYLLNAERKIIGKHLTTQDLAGLIELDQRGVSALGR